VSVVITNVSDHDGSDRLSEYVVRINNGPVLGRFKHWRANGLAECLRLAADAVDEAQHPNPYATRPSEQAVTEEQGTIERHDFGSKAGDPDWCYLCGEHRSHPAHAESQRLYPFTLLDLDIARIIDPSSFLPGAGEQGQNLAIAKAKRVVEALTAALGAQTPPEGAVTEAAFRHIVEAGYHIGFIKAMDGATDEIREVADKAKAALKAAMEAGRHD
jgi:hypothetical protein